jgi:hypothetical protein
MDTNTKRNEHPRCSCRMCRLGAASNAGQFEHQRVNRKIRRVYKAALGNVLRRGVEDVEPIVVPTDYTD